MLNKHGTGSIYFGVADNSRIIGQSLGKLTLQNITQSIVDNTEPKIFPTIEIVEIDGKSCLIVTASGTNNPYFAYGRSYIRVGESDKSLSVNEIEKHFSARKTLRWESELSEKLIDEVNEREIMSFMNKAKTAKRIDFDFIDVKTTLKKLHLVNNLQLNKAAEVLFCDDNAMEIQTAIFAGTDKLTFLDIKQFKGNLFVLRQLAETYVYS